MRIGARTCWLAGLLLGLGAIAPAQTLNITEYHTPGSQPIGITTGSDNNLWFTMQGSNTIGKVTTNGVFTSYGGLTQGSGPFFITSGPDGALWFTEYFANKIGRIDTKGLVTEYDLPTPNSYPEGIVAGPDGAIWFTEYGSNQIGKFINAEFAEFPIPTQSSFPVGITAGPDGALWFTESGGNNIGRITTTGSIMEFPVTTPGSGLDGITTGPDGALWFTETLANNIGQITLSGAVSEFPVPSPSSYPEGITLGPDGALWFTEYHGDNIGRVTTVGVFNEYQLPGTGRGAEAITTGPDGALWFSETLFDSIGRAGLVPQLIVTSSCPMPTGVQGRPYNFTITTSGGLAPLTWALTAGPLPPGLTLDPATGVISGTPTAPGTYPFTVTVTDSSYPKPQTATYTCSIVIVPTLTITASCPAPAGVLGRSYSFPITTSGGLPPLTWTLTSGPLPPGLTLNSATGLISGIPTAAGSYPITVIVVDSLQQLASYTCSIVIVPVLTITATCPAPAGVQGRSYSFPITTSGGLAPLTWALTAGPLPPGLTLNTSTGLISGTPTTPGSYPFTVTVTDSSQQAATYNCTIVIVPVLTVTASCPALSGTVGRPYSFAITTTGGQAPLTWTLTSGPLPPGLTLNTSTGVIAGTPTTNGSYPITVTVTDSSKQTARYTCTIVINGSLTITTVCPLPSVQTGSYYPPLQLTATGGNGDYTFSIIGSLPASLRLTRSTISGLVTAPPGTYTFTLQVNSGGQNAQEPCGITVTPVTAPPLQITSGCPASPLMQGMPFTENLTATGGSGSYSWSIIGSLPNGLTLKGSTISGTPTGPPGVSNFTIQVSSGTQVASISCSLTISPPQLQLTSGCPGNGTVGVPYGPYTLTATGGLGPGSYYFSIQGTLPPGVSLSGNIISGTPTAPGNYSISVIVSSGTQKVTGPSCPIVISSSLQISGICPTGSLLVGVSFSLTASVTGGKAPYSFTFSGPSWLTLSSGTSSATISGTPGPSNTGTFPITITVTDAGQSTATFSCTLTIVNPPALKLGGSCPANPVLPGAPISVPLTATGGVPPYNWTLTGNSGLSLTSPTGSSDSVTGNAPANLGSYSFLVSLSDSAGSAPVTLSCPLTVGPPPLQITGVCPAPNLDLPLTLSVPLTASGGQPPYSWTLTGPSWLGLSPATGPMTVVAPTGTPSTFGPFSFTAQLEDSASSKTAFSCNSSINKPPIPTLTVTGLTAPSGGPFQPITVVIQLSAGSLLPLTGVAQLSFIPNAFGITDNPQVDFDGGQRTATFTIAPGQTSISLPNIQEGTDAGTIQIEIISLEIGTNDVLPVPSPIGSLVIPQSAPVITAAAFGNETSNGFDLVISGYSTPRDMTKGTLTFSAAQGASLSGSVSFTVDLSSLFTQFYSTAASQLVGSMFTDLHIPVTVIGDKSAIGSVSIVLTNSVGSSLPTTLSR